MYSETVFTLKYVCSLGEFGKPRSRNLYLLLIIDVLFDFYKFVFEVSKCKCKPKNEFNLVLRYVNCAFKKYGIYP